jgi:large subunit ribosomal protein L21
LNQLLGAGAEATGARAYHELGKSPAERTPKSLYFSVALRRQPPILTFPWNNGIYIVSYCILETGSKQYRVSAGDTLEIERLAVEAGQPVTFDRVLLVNTEGQVKVGAPTVASASVVADVVEHIRGEKKIAFKMKRRKGYHKTIGHRQELTVVKIKEIKA